jgi:hypothetical protein
MKAVNEHTLTNQVMRNSKARSADGEGAQARGTSNFTGKTIDRYALTLPLSGMY